MQTRKQSNQAKRVQRRRSSACEPAGSGQNICELCKSQLKKLSNCYRPKNAYGSCAGY